MLAAAKDAELPGLIAAHPGIDSGLEAAQRLTPPLIRQLVFAKLRDHNLISAGYKHVDGTSFAAPIAASVAAQMLQANGRLQPQRVKRILIDTARRLPHVPIDRQGWGVIDPRRAVLEAIKTRAEESRKD